MPHDSPSAILDDDPFQNLEQASFSQVLHSSQKVGWDGIELLVYRLSAVEDLSIIPEQTFHQDSITLHLEGSLDLKRHHEGRWLQGLSLPGGLCLVPKYAPILYHWTNVATALSIFFTPSFITDIIYQMGRGDPLRVELRDDFNFRDPLIEHIGRALVAELQSGGLAGRLYAESLAHSMAIHMLRNYANIIPILNLPQGTLPIAQIRQVREYIQAHLVENIGLSELAAIVGLSPSHFARLFKQVTGYAPHQYLILRRLELAKKLLERSHLTIADVAQTVGFYDQSHLIRHFKRVYRISPQMLRHGRNVH
ncbi:MAG: AraC family transcriptional regulator [Chloroflexota bacterium]